MFDSIVKIYVLGSQGLKRKQKNVTTLVLCITKIDVVRAFFKLLQL
jgi:hypothetical protein